MTNLPSTIVFNGFFIGLCFGFFCLEGGIINFALVAFWCGFTLWEIR